MKKIEQYKIDFIKAHKDETPRCELAQRAGVSVKFLYSVLHECGCEFKHKAFIPQPDKKRDAVIIKMYQEYSIREIADALGCHPSTIGKAVKRLKLTHSKETSERLKARSMANLRKAYDSEVIKKRVKSWCKTMRMEKFRLVSGIPQKTNFKFAELPTKAYQAKYNLINKYNYFAFECEPYVIGYDKNTRRVDEQYYKDKYGFTFEEDEPCQED